MMIKKKILQIIKRSESILISTHVNPDPDAICSELALAEYLRSIKKKVTIVNEAPMIERFKFFPGAARVKSLDDVRRRSFDVAIILDCGELSRIGDVQDLIDEECQVINIDHHVTNDRFGSINFVDTKASSTAQVLYEFLTYAKCKMNRRIATNLYCGIMTDTGSFRYENTSSRTHEVAAELIKHNIKVDELYSRIYETIPLQDLAAFTQVINRFEISSRGRVVCLELTRKWTDKFTDDFDLRDAIFKFLRSIAGVEVICILTEFTRNKTRVNLRSASYVDVAKLAHSFDGGGHKRASGCLVEAGLKEAKKKVLRKIKEAL